MRWCKRFSLRTILAFVLLICVSLIVLSRALVRAHRHNQAIRSLVSQDAQITFSDTSKPTSFVSDRFGKPITGRLGMLKRLGWSADVSAIGVDGTLLSPTEFDGISAFVHLQRLDVTGGELTRAMGRTISQLRELKMLFLKECVIADDVYASIGSLPRLTWLSISPKTSSITDENVGALSKLNTLTVMGLTGRGITNRSIESLSRLNSLRVLLLTDVGITADGIEELQRRLPRCSIIINHKKAAVVSQ